MSQLMRALGSDALVVVDATSGNETVTLTRMASGRAVTVRRADSAVYTVTVVVASGLSLDGVLNGTTTVTTNAQKQFIATDSGFESFGGGPVESFGGGPVVSVDADGSLVVDGTTVELGTDSEISGAIAAAASAVVGSSAQRAANLSDLGSAGTARTNLGLGGAAVLAVGTTTGTVAAGDDPRITGAAQKASNLSDLASASTARTNLGLGTTATMTPAMIAADSALTGAFAPKTGGVYASGVGDGVTDDTAALSANITAAAGKTLYLSPTATYKTTGPLNITTSHTVIDGRGATIACSAATNLMQVVDASWIVIRNVHFDLNGQPTGWSGILTQHVSDATDVRIENCTFTAPGSYGIRVTGSAVGSRMVVENCRFFGGSDVSAIQTDNDDDVLITRNYIVGGSGKGIYVGTPAHPGSRCIVSDNHVSGVSGFGIEVNNCPNSVVSGNVVESVGAYGISLDTSSDSTISGNVINGFTGVGIELVACDSVGVSGNAVHYTAGGSSGQGMSIDKSSRVAVSGCTFRGFGVDGISVYGVFGTCEYVAISGCTFLGNNTTGAVGVRLNTCTNVTISACTIQTAFVGVRGVAMAGAAVVGTTMTDVAYGTYVDGCSEIRVGNCTMIGNAHEYGNGLSFVTSGTGFSCVGNRITGFTGAMGGQGVVLASVDYVTILGSDLRGNRVMIQGTAANQVVASNL